MLNINLLRGHYHRSALAWQVSIVVHLVGEGAKVGYLVSERPTHALLLFRGRCPVINSWQLTTLRLSMPHLLLYVSSVYFTKSIFVKQYK